MYTISNLGHKNPQGKTYYSTIDRRKTSAGEYGPQYDEIPYGDVPPPQLPPSANPANGSGKGKLPEVPSEYSQIPQIPARQGNQPIADRLTVFVVFNANVVVFDLYSSFSALQSAASSAVKTLITSSFLRFPSLLSEALVLDALFVAINNTRNIINISVGGSINPQTGEEDISPYATFHLLGMREENKNGPHPAGAANFQTMPHPPHQQQGGPQQVAQQMTQQPQQPNTPARQASQTMNVSVSIFTSLRLFLFFQQQIPRLMTIRRACHDGCGSLNSLASWTV